MLHPVGSQPPSVYWRRRLLVAASVIMLLILLVLTVKAVFSGSGGTPSGQGGHTPGKTTGQNTPTENTPTKTPTSSGAKTTGKASSTATTPPAKCLASQLKVQAVVAKSQYKVGDEPVLTLQVTNSGTRPCVQDVADPQIVLRVYNGASRVWGSHDCQTTPGVTEKTLPVGKPIGFSLTWSGLTAQPGCASTRQRVGAGTYTVYATLAGVDGKAAQFTIS
jgi:hypothetical protein